MREGMIVEDGNGVQYHLNHLKYELLPEPGVDKYPRPIWVCDVIEWKADQKTIGDGVLANMKPVNFTYFDGMRAFKCCALHGRARQVALTAGTLWKDANHDTWRIVHTFNDGPLSIQRVGLFWWTYPNVSVDVEAFERNFSFWRAAKPTYY